MYSRWTCRTIRMEEEALLHNLQDPARRAVKKRCTCSHSVAPGVLAPPYKQPEVLPPSLGWLRVHDFDRSAARSDDAADDQTTDSRQDTSETASSSLATEGTASLAASAASWAAEP